MWSAVSQFTLHWQVWIKVQFGPSEQIKEVPHWLFIVPVLSSLVLVHRLSCGMMGRVSESTALVHQQYGVSRGAPVSLPLLALSLTEATAAEKPVWWCSPAYSEKVFLSSTAVGAPSPSPGHPSVPAGTAPFFTHTAKEKEQRQIERSAWVTPGIRSSSLPFVVFSKVGQLVHISVTPPVHRRVGLANTLHQVHL